MTHDWDGNTNVATARFMLTVGNRVIRDFGTIFEVLNVFPSMVDTKQKVVSPYCTDKQLGAVFDTVQKLFWCNFPCLILNILPLSYTLNNRA